MQFMKKIYFILLFLIPFTLNAQVSVNIDPLDPLNRKIEKLIHFGLVKDIIVGHKPYSRSEMTRILTQALNSVDQKTFKPKTRQKIDQILAELKKEFQQELIQRSQLEGQKKNIEFKALEKANVSFLYTNSETRNYNNNGMGEIDVRLNPIFQNTQGRKFSQGGTFALETEHWLRLSDYVAFDLSPRAQLGIGRNSSKNENHLELRQVYAKLAYKNFEILLGRDYLNWGQGLNGGFLLSNNARALDLFKISNDRPFRFPWIFKYLGNQKISFIFTDLGPEQGLAHSYITGFKWSLQPATFMEIGFSILNQAGGEGGPSASLGERIADVFQFGPGNKQLSNKIGGIDLRFRIPPWRGMEIYGEASFDDKHTLQDLHGQLVSDAAYLLGVYFPRLKDDGTWDLRMELHRTGNRFYRHATFQSGWTLNRFLLGDPLGPDAWGLYLNSNYELNQENTFALQLSYEHRSADLWTAGALFEFIKIQDLPEEKRIRAHANWFFNFESLPLSMQLQFAYERVLNFNNQLGRSKNHFLSGIEFSYRR